jgi:hypothetical protein
VRLVRWRCVARKAGGDVRLDARSGEAKAAQALSSFVEDFQERAARSGAGTTNTEWSNS